MLTEGTNLICYIKPPNHAFDTNIIPISSISLSLQQDNRDTSEFEFLEKSQGKQLNISMNKTNGQTNETTSDMKPQAIHSSEGKNSMSSSVHWLICEVFQVSAESISISQVEGKVKEISTMCFH